MWGLAVLVLSTAACFQHTYHVGAGAPAAPVTTDQWRHHWLGGLISPDKEMNIRAVCPSGDATIEQEQTFLNGLVGVLTGGLYMPTTVQVRCAGGSVALDLTSEEVERIVTSTAFLDRIGEEAPSRLRDVESALEVPADF